MEGINVSIAHQIREIIDAYAEPQEPPCKRHHPDETTEIYGALRELDRSLTPEQKLDAHSVSVLKPLLSDTDTDIQHLAAKILLNHNHDIALQTTDAGIVPLSFAVLSKYSEIFPEDSDFLSHNLEPIPVPLSFSSLELMRRAWSGESPASLLNNFRSFPKMKELLTASAYLASDDAIHIPHLIYDTMRALAPNLDYSIPRRMHMHLTCSCNTQRQANQLRHALSLAKAVNYIVSLELVSVPKDPSVWVFTTILSNDKTYPIHALSLPTPFFPQREIDWDRLAKPFFNAIKNNQTLEELEMPFFESHKEWIKAFLAALKVNKGIKTLTLVHDDCMATISDVDCIATFRANTSVESVTLGDNTIGALPIPLVKGLSASTSLTHVVLNADVEEAADEEAVKELIVGSPRLESIGVTPFSGIEGVLPAAHSLSALHVMEFEVPFSFEPIRMLLESCPNLKELSLWLSTHTSNSAHVIEGLRANKTLTSLSLGGPDLGFYFEALLEAVEQHPSLSALSLSRYFPLTEQGWLCLCRFIKNNENLLRLGFNKTSLLNARDSIPSLVRALKENTTLKSLTLAHCNLSSQDGLVLARYLEENSSLQELNLQDNNFNLTACNAFAEALCHNTTLRSLNLGKTFNWIWPYRRQEPHAFTRMLSENRTLRHLDLTGFDYLSQRQLSYLKRITRRKEFFDLEV